MTKLEEEVADYYEWRFAPLRQRLQAVKSGLKEPEPPPELLVLLDLEKFGKLPWDGGLFDQPDILMMLLKVCHKAREDAELVRDAQDDAEELKKKNGKVYAKASNG